MRFFFLFVCVCVCVEIVQQPTLRCPYASVHKTSVKDLHLGDNKKNTKRIIGANSYGIDL